MTTLALDDDRMLNANQPAGMRIEHYCTG